MRRRLLCFFMLGSLSLATLSFGSVGQQSSNLPLRPAVPPQLTRLPASVLNAELKSARGGSFKLSDYSGKVLVVNLWATWLGPSRMETPELVKLQAHFWSQGVRVVGLSTESPDQSAEEVRAWVRNFRIQYKIGWATTDVAITLMQGRDAIPQTFVISGTGRIVKRFVGFNPQFTPRLVKEAIQEALDERAKVLRNSGSPAQDTSPTPLPPTQTATKLPASVLHAELKTPSGRSFKLADYSGKVLVIELWETGCRPCSFETRELVKLHKQFRTRGVEIVSLVSYDLKASDKDLRAWMRRYRLRYLIARNTPDVARILSQPWQDRVILPQTIVISRSGRVVTRFLGFDPKTTPRQWRQAIKDELNEMTF